MALRTALLQVLSAVSLAHLHHDLLQLSLVCCSEIAVRVDIYESLPVDSLI